LKELHHQNIIRILHGFFTSTWEGLGQRETKLNIVMDFVPGTITRVQKEFAKLEQKIHPLLTKLYAYQLIRALNYLHLKGIAHRDIKPQNCLVDPSCHILKLCDFGSSKRLVNGELSTAYTSSRYYRAPELLLGQRDYGTEIDIWAAGCVIAEMLLSRPLFVGTSSKAQLEVVIKKLGTPHEGLVKILNPDFHDKMPKMQP
jgi:serine/threonine protein kinase